MKKELLRLLLMLALPLTLGLASCSDDDPDEPNGGPLSMNVKGLWYDTIELEGTMPDEYGSGDYTRVINAMQFNEDGTGYGVTFFLDNESSEPIAVIGGQGLAPFTYTTTQDGDISVNYDTAYPDYADFYKLWDISYANETITFTNSVITFNLKEATDAMAAVIRAWDAAANGGAEIVVKNPNDGVFTAETWRDEEGIYIYDGVIHSLDDKDHAGFQLVPLPWYKGSRESNLPMNFCDNLTREAGWDLVLNNCGNNTMPNGNYFALYNKWTGTLRFFFYMPQSFSAGNDHLWQVTLTGQTALHQGLNYGLPLDGQIVNPAAIGMTTNGYSKYVSPYAENRSTDGKLTPNGGWWAFDVDLSQYHPGLDISRDEIRLQMRSWTEQSASFYSTITADIDGKIEGSITEETSGDSAEAAFEGIQCVFSGLSAGAHAVTGDFGYMFESLGGVFEHGFNSASAAEGSSTTQSFDATLTMTMNGSMDTKGIIRSSTPVTGIAAPTFLLSQFDTKNTTMGQGIWNLKNTPVVWLTNAITVFNNTIQFWKDYNEDMVYDVGNWYFPSNTAFYFFDPSNIEVELNPNLFPASDVEWTQVDAYCVGRADNGVTGTDNYRTAFGLSPRQYYDDPGAGSPIVGIQDEDGYVSHGTFERYAHVYDFLYYNDDKMKFEYPAVVSTPKHSGGNKGNGFYDAIVGRGTSGKVAIEPMVLTDNGRNDQEHYMRVPGLEVMVRLQVKLKSRNAPLVYVRHYLPDVKKLDMERYNTSQQEEIYKNIKAHQPKGNGVNRTSPAYDYEMERIGKVLKYINKNFKGE